jgi:hypothetical protein
MAVLWDGRAELINTPHSGVFELMTSTQVALITCLGGDGSRPAFRRDE